MSKRIVIDPVTRIEGHAKISIFMDDAGNVADAEFHVVEFRGFEKFCEGRPYSEMPGITQGPWTDIFALASVLYAAISGGRTMASVERLLNDQMPRLAGKSLGVRRRIVCCSKVAGRLGKRLLCSATRPTPYFNREARELREQISPA